jgi:Tfp pilus assembly protein PilZ
VAQPISPYIAPQPIAPQPVLTPQLVVPQPVAVQPPAPQRISAAPQHPARGVRSFEVELGTHSTSNFYKGLGGNDVIDAGGIFVATYKIPNIGSTVNLRVLLPGDYEFQATGVVQWTREASTTGDSHPGFGARFTQIGAEGRQLVYRYTRNREPMFYDDL